MGEPDDIQFHKGAVLTIVFPGRKQFDLVIYWFPGFIGFCHFDQKQPERMTDLQQYKSVSIFL